MREFLLRNTLRYPSRSDCGSEPYQDFFFGIWRRDWHQPMFALRWLSHHGLSSSLPLGNVRLVGLLGLIKVNRMKTRSYDFQLIRRKVQCTKREIIESLLQFARERGTTSFTEKQYDPWLYRALCSHQIAERFGGWPCAMQKAGLEPRWRPRPDLTELVELFVDCWEQHDDPPGEKVLKQFLGKNAPDLTVHMYKHYFGGVRRLASRVADFHLGRISEAQLVERFKPAQAARQPLPPAMRTLILKRDGYHCVRCGHGRPLDIHHKVPVAEGGSDDPENLETLCKSCHLGEHSS